MADTLDVIATLALLALAVQNPLKDPTVFPIAVWLQEPSMATKYRDAGFNLYIGLWQGPTEKQLADLKAAGMPVICEQNAVGLAHVKDPIIAGWMHGDEPDNAQPMKDPATGKDTWGPCVPPEKIVREYEAMKKADPSRPVMLNLGQGVANDAWYGRGNGAKLDDYKTYVQGCDIVSFDVYPVAGLGKPDQLSLVAKGVDRLKGWTEGKRRVWNCLECTDIGGTGKPTPAQVRSEAWSALIHGSNGLIYFVHQFKPRFDEHALLDDPEMLKAVTKLNQQIQSLASLLKERTASDANLDAHGARVDFTTRRRGNTIYVFAASLETKPVDVDLKLPASKVEVVDEDRTVTSKDHFEPFGVHIYRVTAR